MTQAVTNNLNNIQEMLNQAQQAVSKTQTALNSGMDNGKDFSKIIDKTIKDLKQADKEQSDVNVSKENAVLDFESKSEVVLENSNAEVKVLEVSDVKTLDDLKSLETLQTLSDLKKLDLDSVNIELADGLREILDQVITEESAENALDLTLSKDISEIIAQLKEFLQKDVDAKTTLDDVDNSVVIELDEENTSENAISEEIESTDADKADLESNDSKMPIFEQLISYMNNKSDANVKNDLKIVENIKLDDMKAVEGEALTIDFSQEESLDVVTENLTNKTSNDTNDAISQDVDFNLDEEMLKELKIESVKADTGTLEGDSLLQNQTPEEQGVKIMLNQQAEGFDLKFDKAINLQQTQTTPSVQAKAVDINPSKIIEQISKQLEGMQNNSKVSIVLNPESLGKVNIHLMSTKEGLTAQIMVSSPETRDILMKGLDGLKESLLSHGVGVDNVSVKVGDAEKSEYNADWTEQEGSRGGNKEQGKSNQQEKEKGLFEKLMAQNVEDENGKV